MHPNYLQSDIFSYSLPSSRGLGRAAVCDCGTPWTCLLPFLAYQNSDPINPFIVLRKPGIYHTAFFEFYTLSFFSPSHDLGETHALHERVCEYRDVHVQFHGTVHDGLIVLSFSLLTNNLCGA